MLTEEKIRSILHEELTKSEVNKIVDDKIDRHIRSKELKDKVSDIVADVIDEFFRNLWTKNAFWKPMLKKK